MEINVTQEKGKVPVSVVRLKGDLDASSYLDLVNTAQKLYNAGVRSLLLNLAKLAFISSAGLASLHIVAKIFRGETANSEDDWATNRERENGSHKHVKLLNPTPEVDSVLDTVGFKQFFKVYTDLEDAVGSF